MSSVPPPPPEEPGAGSLWPAQPPPPLYQYQYGPPPRPTNGLAVASMVLGILWIYWIGSVLALVFGYIARAQIRQRNEAGDGMAIAGIVLGWIGVGVLVAALIALVVFAAAREDAGTITFERLPL